MFHSPHHPRSPPLDSLQQLLIFLEVGSPELDTALQMRPPQGRAEGKENLPRPAGHTLLNAPQDPIGLLGRRKLLTPPGKSEDDFCHPWEAWHRSQVGKTTAKEATLPSEAFSRRTPRRGGDVRGAGEAHRCGTRFICLGSCSVKLVQVLFLENVCRDFCVATGKPRSGVVLHHKRGFAWSGEVSPRLWPLHFTSALCG